MLRRAGKGVELATANALWMQKDRVFRGHSLALTRTHYRAGCRHVDFIGNTESARLTINGWTEEQTHRRIRDLLPPGVIPRDTRLVLTNAVYFKAKWDKEFDKATTSRPG
jgi:serpin B